MNDFQGSLNELEEHALQNMFDDIFDIPSSNYLLDGQDPVEGFTANTPLWTARQLIAAVYYQLNSSCPEWELVTRILLFFHNHRELLESNSNKEILASENVQCEADHDEAEDEERTLTTTFLQLINSPHTDNHIKLLAMHCLEFSDTSTGNQQFVASDYFDLFENELPTGINCRLNAIVLARFLGRGCADTVQFLKDRWKSKDARHEVEATLLQLINELIPISDENVTSLFSAIINSAEGLCTLFKCHDEITPQQMSHLTDLALRVWTDSVLPSSISDGGFFAPFFSATNTLCLKEETVGVEELEKKTFLPDFFSGCTSYYEVSPWNSVSPTFLAFLKKAVLKKKPWLFFKTLREDALGQLVSRSNAGFSLSDLDSSTKCSLAILNRVCQIFESKKSPVKSLVHFNQLFKLTLCCYGQAVYGERLLKEQYSEPFAPHIGKKKLLLAEDHIPLSMFTSLLSDHKTVNDVIAENRDSLSETTRLRFYYLNGACPSPSLLYLALIDSSTPNSGKVAMEAHRLIMNNIPAFSKMASLMLARSEGNQLKNILTYLGLYNGAQITAIVEPYISEYIENEPAEFSRFILETLNVDLNNRVKEITDNSAENVAEPLKKCILLLNKLIH